MDTKFLDEAIGQLARGGPQGTWQVGLDGSGPRLVAYESADTWAKRVAEQALALATARERLLLDVQTGGATAVGIPEDCPKCESERRKADERDQACADAEHRHAVAEKERDGACATASEWLGLLTALDDIMVEAGRPKKAQPEEAQKWLRAALKERDEARAEVERLRAENANLRETLSGRTFSEPPAVCVVDVEAVEREFRANGFYGVDRLMGVLRKHIRSADPEAVAGAIREGLVVASLGGTVSMDGCRTSARAALAHLGVALAEPKSAADFLNEGARRAAEACGIDPGRVVPLAEPAKPSLIRGLSEALAAAKTCDEWAHKALAEKPAAPAPGGWLIEVTGPLYWTGRDGCGAWADHNDAIRFARWEDADRIRRTMGFDAAACREHAWIPRATEAQREPEIVRPVPAVECAPAPGGFVADKEKMRGAFLIAHVNWRPSDHDRDPADGGPVGRGIDAAIAEYERQRAEHAKGGAA